MRIHHRQRRPKPHPLPKWHIPPLRQMREDHSPDLVCELETPREEEGEEEGGVEDGGGSWGGRGEPGELEEGGEEEGEETEEGTEGAPGWRGEDVCVTK